MTVRHHLSDELIVGYASGSLAEGWSIAVATHLALCPACRRRLSMAEAIGGALLQGLAGEQSVDASWASVRDRLERRPRAGRSGAEPRGVAASEDDRLPEPLRSYAGGDIAALDWRALGGGAYQVPISTSDEETRVRLLRIPAGRSVPEHGHSGRELTLVLAGSFVDGDLMFTRGDVEEADASLTHRPVATPEADCICLSVTDGPLRFRSRIVGAIQPFLDI